MSCVFLFWMKMRGLRFGIARYRNGAEVIGRFRERLRLIGW